MALANTFSTNASRAMVTGERILITPRPRLSAPIVPAMGGSSVRPIMGLPQELVQHLNTPTTSKKAANNGQHLSSKAARDAQSANGKAAMGVGDFLAKLKSIDLDLCAIFRVLLQDFSKMTATNGARSDAATQLLSTRFAEAVCNWPSITSPAMLEELLQDFEKFAYPCAGHNPREGIDISRWKGLQDVRERERKMKLEGRVVHRASQQPR